MENALTSIPAEIIAGDSVSWRLSLPYFPASDGWEIAYALVKDGNKIVITETGQDGDIHLFDIPSTTTAIWQAGEYIFQQYATRDTERRTLAGGRVTVRADFLSMEGGHDGRTPAERTLDLLLATYDQVAAKSLSQKSAGGASTVDKELTELREQIDKQRAVVALERRKKRIREGKRPGTKVKVRFV